jgi:hypothetical protein
MADRPASFEILVVLGVFYFGCLINDSIEGVEDAIAKVDA